MHRARHVAQSHAADRDGLHQTGRVTVFPEMSSGHTAYTLVGMGAVAGAVLGSPISTILMVFELSGNYALTVAVMIATALASLLTRYLHGGSFFTWQLESRGISLEGAREQRLLQSISVGEIMRDDFRRRI